MANIGRSYRIIVGYVTTIIYADNASNAVGCFLKVRTRRPYSVIPDHLRIVLNVRKVDLERHSVVVATAPFIERVGISRRLVQQLPHIDEPPYPESEAIGIAPATRDGRPLGDHVRRLQPATSAYSLFRPAVSGFLINPQTAEEEQQNDRLLLSRLKQVRNDRVPERIPVDRPYVTGCAIFHPKLLRA